MLRRLLLYLFAVGVFLLPASPLHARERVHGWCEQGGNTLTVVGLETTDTAQQSFPGCTVTVWDAGTTDIASIFSDDVGTIKANPFTADSTTGLWFFYADDSRYDVQLSGAGIAAPFTLADFMTDDIAQAVTVVSTVASSATPAFDAGAASIFTNILTANVTSSTITNGVTGQVITIYIAQDGTGGWTFAWPADVVLRTGTLVVSDDADAVTVAAFYYTGTEWREIGVDSDEVGRVLVPVTTGDAFGSLTRRWNVFVAAMDISGAFTGDLVPAVTGQDVGSATARPDVFLELGTFYDVFAPNVTGVDIGTVSARPDGIFDVMTVGLWSNIPIVDGNKFATIQAALASLGGSPGQVWFTTDPGAVTSDITLVDSQVLRFFFTGTLALGTNSILVNENSAIIADASVSGSDEPALVFTYTGSGSAIAPENAGVRTRNVRLQGFRVLGPNGAGPGSTGIGVDMLDGYGWKLDSVSVRYFDGVGGIGIRVRDTIADGANFNDFTDVTVMNSETCFQVDSSGGGTGPNRGRVVNMMANTCTDGYLFTAGDTWNMFGLKGQEITDTALTFGGDANYVFGATFENTSAGTSTGIKTLAGANLNMFIGTFSTFNTEISDSGSNNWINTDLQRFRVSSAGAITSFNNNDSGHTFMNARAGATTDQNLDQHWRSWDNVLLWIDRKSTAGDRIIRDDVNSLDRLRMVPGADTFLNSDGTKPVDINATTASGTGGLRVWSGGGSPAVVFTVNGVGEVNIAAGGFAADADGYKHIRSTVGCATAASVGATCDTTVTFGTAFADANFSPICNGIGIASGVPANGGQVSKAAANVVFRTVAITAAAAQFTNIVCAVPHD